MQHTLRTLVANYLDDLEASASPAHLSRVRGILERLLADLRDRPLAELGPEDVTAWRAERRRGGASKATANKEVGTLQAALRWAEQSGMLESHPVTRVRRLRIREADLVRRPRALAPGELARLLDAADTLDRHRCGEPAGSQAVPQAPTWHLFIATGARRGELCAARWDALDLERGVLLLRATSTKGGRSRRLPLAPALCERLAALRQAQAQRLGREIGGRDTLLRSPAGTPWSSNLGNLRRALSELLRAAGVVAEDPDGRRLTLHGLRHTYATILASRGVHPEVARQLLGHADVGLTLRVYTHLEDEGALRAGAGHVADVLAGAPLGVPKLDPALALGSHRGGGV